MRREELDRIAAEIDQMRARLAAMKDTDATTALHAHDLTGLRQDLRALRNADPGEHTRVRDPAI